MIRRILVVQHAAGETAGTLGDTLLSRGVDVSTVRTFDGDTVPEVIADASALVVLGGEMGVDELDRYPHLSAELRLIRGCVEANLPVLGICLGSQLLAHALGARVTPTGNPEIGWHPVQLEAPAADDPVFQSVPSRFPMFHWHGDAFTVPPRAVSLASSERTPCQAFRYGEATYGIQFHPEVTPEVLNAMLIGSAEQLAGWGASEAEIRREAVVRLPVLRELGSQIFGRWIDLISRATSGN